MQQYGLSWPLSVALLAFLVLSSCGSLPSFLSGGGTNVAANVPIAVGKEVEQVQGVKLEVGKSSNPSVTLRPKARVDTIDQSNTTTTNNELPLWVWIVFILLFIVGWVTDTPYTYIQRMTKKTK
jgi:hypothetical protein